MYVKLKKSASAPPWAIFTRKKKPYVEIRAVATWTSTDPFPEGKETIKYEKFVKNVEDLVDLPDKCEINIMFEDGTYVQLPLLTFKSIFTVIPKGEYTSALFGH